ncbi:MAG: carbohydrate kinase family protein [Burkholderiales bacterium]
MSRYDILNLGTAMVDIPVKLPYKTLDFKTELTRIDNLKLMPGGDAANSSIALSQLGNSVALIAAVGDDAFGNEFLRQVQSRGVDVSHVAVKKGVNMSVCCVMVNSDGDRCFLFTQGSSETLCEGDFDYSLLDSGARHLNYSSFFLHPPLDSSGVESIFRAAKERGLTVSADANTDYFNVGFEGVRKYLEYLDCFMPSYAEAKHLTGETEPGRMAEFIANKTGVKTIIIKLGAEGSYLYSNGKGGVIPAFSVKTVDTTGAGDNFVAGFLSAMLSGMDTEDCVRFGNAAAALKIQHVGATSPVVTSENVRAFLKERGVNLG